MAENLPSIYENGDLLVDIDHASLFIPGEKQRKLVLRNINLQIPPSTHFTLVGANGSGKSTLLRLIHGELWLSSGSICWLDGKNMCSSPIVAKSLTALVSPLIQGNLHRHSAWVSVENFLAASLPNNNSPQHKDKYQNIYQLLEQLESDNILSIPLSALSQGQFRLALLARAILLNPKLLLLDEYTDGLDDRHKELVFGLLAEISSDTAMIFATHRKDGAPQWADNILYIENGILSCEPNCLDVVNDKTRAIKENTRYFLKITAEERKKESSPNNKESNVGKVLISLDNVSVYVDRQHVLKKISWQMSEGENWAITGENGSGKSTFLRSISGDEFVAAGGSLRLYDMRSGTLLESLLEIRKNIRLVSDLGQEKYDYPVTALELVLSGFDYSVGIYREFDKSELIKAQAILEKFFPNSNIATASIRRLSTGQLRKLFLARALMGNPQIILLDEACTGLDDRSRNEFLALVNDLANGVYTELPIHFIMASHYAEDFPSCINWRMHMDRGSIKFVEKI